MKKDKMRIKIAQKAIKMQNMITINACLETDDYIYYDDVIYVEFSRTKDTPTGGKTYDTENSLSFKFSSLALRQLGYGIKELMQFKKTEYIKISEPRLFGSDGAKKTLSLGMNEKDGITKFFINAKKDNEKNIALSFFCYELNGIVDLLNNIADLTDSKQFEIQRHIDKTIRESNKNKE